MAVPSPSPMANRLAEAIAGDGDAALERWAACGAMALTGAADGPPLSIPARVALAADAFASTIAEVSDRIGRAVRVDGAMLLGERAAIARLERQGPRSCGGATQLLRASDGWLALSLARAEDVQLLEAWLGEAIGVPAGTPMHDWAPVAAAVGRRTRAELVAAGALLGLPCAALGEVSTAAPLVEVAARKAGQGRSRSIGGLRVIDLSALWAGPLCAQLLGQAGARVIKVESESRPDGARFGPPEFFDLLHAGHESVALDFTTHDGRQWLRRLIESADIVIEASRPRALAALGASFESVRDAGWSGVWVSITGYGRRGDAGRRVAFGDDAAVAGGLVGDFDGGPVFCADAVADPLSGLLAAALVLECVDQGLAGIIDVSLARTAAHVAAGVRRGPSISQTAIAKVAAPRARVAAGRAACIGAHTVEVLSTL